MGAKERRAAHGANVKVKDLPHLDPEDLFLVTDPTAPLYDRRVLDVPDENTVLNMMVYGPLQPVIAVKNTEMDRYEIADGRGRVLALREANKRIRNAGGEIFLMPYVVKRVDVGAAIGIMISANEIRREDSPSNRANKANRMLEHGKTEEDVAVALGVHPQTVKKMVQFLDACAAVRNAADTGKITMTAAYKLALLPAQEATEKVAALIAAAPRVPGKKRATKVAAQATRAILDGPETTAEAKDTNVTGLKANDFGHRTDNQIENAAQEIATSAKFSGETARVVTAFAAWLLGDDGALDALLKSNDKSGDKGVSKEVTSDVA